MVNVQSDLSSSGQNLLVNFIGWTFVPNIATQILQSFLYRFKKNPPVQGTQEFVRDYRRIFAFGICLYILYTLYHADQALGINYYQVLGLDRHQVANEVLLRRQSRAISIRYHPDKNKTPGAAEYFVTARKAVELFSELDTRLAYEKMGPIVAGMNKASTYREYMIERLTGFIMYYVVTGGILVLLNMFGQVSYGKYWRFVVLLGMFAAEGILLLKQTSILSEFFYLVLPHRATFQHIEFLHSLFMSFSIAQNQVGPVLFPPEPEEEPAKQTNLRPLIDRLALLTNALSQDADEQLVSAIEPFKDDPQAIEQMKAKMQQLALDLTLRSNETVRDAYVAAAQAPTPPPIENTPPGTPPNVIRRTPHSSADTVENES